MIATVLTVQFWSLLVQLFKQIKKPKKQNKTKKKKKPNWTAYNQNILILNNRVPNSNINQISPIPTLCMLNKNWWFFSL